MFCLYQIGYDSPRQIVYPFPWKDVPVGGLTPSWVILFLGLTPSPGFLCWPSGPQTSNEQFTSCNHFSLSWLFCIQLQIGSYPTWGISLRIPPPRWWVSRWTPCLCGAPSVPYRDTTTSATSVPSPCSTDSQFRAIGWGHLFLLAAAWPAGGWSFPPYGAAPLLMMPGFNIVATNKSIFPLLLGLFHAYKEALEWIQFTFNTY